MWPLVARKLLTPDLRYPVFNTLTRLSTVISEKNSANLLLFYFLPMFWLHNILDDLRDQQPSDLVSLTHIAYIRWRLAIEHYRVHGILSSEHIYKDVSPLCSRSGQRFHGISDDLTSSEKYSKKCYL
ncbi:hypothetical protein Tsp_01387 [Trichinella spiralis]|uniref:hypothetical protein n=1 Tax=Trichinella spiralis TaxID=6334 RepID=UPI0001EFB2D3|nr:hypothetical protein Tsp_01387 [Trichinella spiralis]